MISEKAKIEVFVEKQSDPPKHLKYLRYPCVQCQEIYHIYIVADGDMEFHCHKCGLYQVASGPWVIYN